MQKEIAESYANAVWNEKDLSVIDSLIHPSALIHSLLGNFHGPEDMKKIVGSWLKSFPDLKVKHLATIQEGNKVVIQWEAKGTHQGEFKDIAPSGKSVAYSGVTIYRIQEGKIIEYWAYVDMQHLLNQIQ
jgi:steroid delta-isomerase-like uncharacterized protein